MYNSDESDNEIQLRHRKVADKLNRMGSKQDVVEYMLPKGPGNRDMQKVMICCVNNAYFM